MSRAPPPPPPPPFLKRPGSFCAYDSLHYLEAPEDARSCFRSPSEWTRRLKSAKFFPSSIVAAALVRCRVSGTEKSGLAHKFIIWGEEKLETDAALVSAGSPERL